MTGLSPRQESAHSRIMRCPGCGAWEIVTGIEHAMRAAELMPPFRPPCDHDNRVQRPETPAVA